MKKDRPDKINENDTFLAKFISIIIRNELEDFCIKNIPDSEMKELNITIRNSVATGLTIMRNWDNVKVQGFKNHQIKCIPHYWEEPELLDDYLECLGMDTE